MKIYEVELKEVVRQKKHSDILANATLLRQNLTELDFEKPVFQIGEESDVEKISGEDLVETITMSYDRYGLSSTIVVCRSNKNANKYNEGIRRTILWKESEIALGDLMMVVKNNYFWIEENEEIDFIANGDIFEIVRIKNYEELYGYRYANITARFVDYHDLEIDLKIFLDTIMLEKAAFSQDENKELYYQVLDDYKHIKNRKSQYEAVRNNPYFNALQVKFAYAVTCHKAQGGQWKNVFVDQGYFTDDGVNEEYMRWLYTAITRSTDKLYLVNFPKEFFDTDEF